MSIQPEALNEQEHRAILCVCILAAFADGAQDEVERAQIERILSGFSDQHLDLASAYQDVLSGKLSLAQTAPQLQSAPSRALAYEMAVCVCNADGILKDSERQFLAELRKGLQLDNNVVEAHQEAAQAMAAHPLTIAPPVIDSGRDAEIDHL